MVKKGASPPPGKPRTKTFAPDSPPELSTQTPGIALNKSAVDFGAKRPMSPASMFVTAKLASIFLIPAPPGVPLTIITSVLSLVGCFDSSCAMVGCASATATALASIPFVNNVFMVCAPEKFMFVAN